MCEGFESFEVPGSSWRRGPEPAVRCRSRCRAPPLFGRRLPPCLRLSTPVSPPSTFDSPRPGISLRPHSHFT